MNNSRRKELLAALPLLAAGLAQISDARDAIQSVRDDEQSAYDELSEGRQNGDAGEAMQSAITELDTALEEIDDMVISEKLVRALEDVADRTVDLEAKEPKLTKSEREARRRDRLPEWAKDHIRKLVENIGRLQDDAKAQFGEPTGKESEFVVADHVTPLEGRVIPAKRIRAVSLKLTIEVDRHGRGLEISHQGFGSQMVVVPSAGNSLFIQVLERK